MLVWLLGSMKINSCPCSAMIATPIKSSNSRNPTIRIIQMPRVQALQVMQVAVTIGRRRGGEHMAQNKMTLPLRPTATVLVMARTRILKEDWGSTRVNPMCRVLGITRGGPRHFRKASYNKLWRVLIRAWIQNELNGCNSTFTMNHLFNRLHNILWASAILIHRIDLLDSAVLRDTSIAPLLKIMISMNCRILANRQSAQRSRVRKLQYISELERSVTALQVRANAFLTCLENNGACGMSLKDS
jgi:hypothetical protein